MAESDPRIRLPVFEGPLDLLLFLIRKSEIDVYDIPIESVLRQYLSVLRTMTDLQLEIAGDFFVMAATLMEIKSRMLLPRDQQAVDPETDDSEPVDPRWDLVHQLLQYKRFKEAAGRLGELVDDQQNSIARDSIPGWTAPSEDRPLAGSDCLSLWGVFNAVLRRLAEQIVVGEINDEHVTVVDQMEVILGRIAREREFLFSTLFTAPVSLRALVVTFLAVLELTRLRKLRVQQDVAFGDIQCLAWIEEIPLESPES